MSELERTKEIIVNNLQKLCAHCVNGHKHDCRVKKISEEILNIRGVPLIVNDEFRGVLFR
jgi:hypothetical protein